MTFAVWFTALLAVFTLSSCLDDGGSNTYPVSGYVKVGGMMGNYYFTNQLNEKFVPTNPTVLPTIIDADYGFITGSINKDQQQSSKEVPVDIQGYAFAKSAYMSGSTEHMKDYANAPISLVNGGTMYSAVPVGFWNPTIMFVPVYYFVKGANNQNGADEAEKSAHSFSFYYKVGGDSDIINSTESDLVIYVRHRVVNPEENKNRKMMNMDLYQLNLNEALAAFGEQYNGKKPQQIFVEYENNSADGAYDSTVVRSTNARIDYQAYLNLFEKK